MAPQEAEGRGRGQRGPDPHMAPLQGSCRGQLRADIKRPPGRTVAARWTGAHRKVAAGTARNKTRTKSGTGGRCSRVAAQAQVHATCPRSSNGAGKGRRGREPHSPECATICSFAFRITGRTDRRGTAAKNKHVLLLILVSAVWGGSGGDNSLGHTHS